MSGSFAGSRLAVALRRWRGRFGIAAPRVAVRTHIPWYWRAAAIVAMAAVALSLAGWIYDAGRRFAGFDHSESVQELGALRARMEGLETELARLRRISDASEANLQIERTTQQQLSRQVRTLEDENTRLKEDLAVFESLAQTEAKDGGVSLSRLRIEPGARPGEYRYRLLAAVHGQQKGREFKGNVQVAVALQGEGDGVMMHFPRPGDPEVARYSVSFRNFRRLEGSFSVPGDAKIKSVEVRLIQDGAVKASQRAVL